MSEPTAWFHLVAKKLKALVLHLRVLSVAKVNSFVTFILPIKIYTMRHRDIPWTLPVTTHKMVSFSKMLPQRLWLEVHKPKRLHNFLPVTTAPKITGVPQIFVRTYMNNSKDSIQALLTQASAFVMTKPKCTPICSCAHLSHSAWNKLTDVWRISSTPSRQGSVQSRPHS